MLLNNPYIITKTLSDCLPTPNGICEQLFTNKHDVKKLQEENAKLRRQIEANTRKTQKQKLHDLTQQLDHKNQLIATNTINYEKLSEEHENLLKELSDLKNTKKLNIIKSDIKNKYPNYIKNIQDIFQDSNVKLLINRIKMINIVFKNDKQLYIEIIKLINSNKEFEKILDRFPILNDFDNPIYNLLKIQCIINTNYNNNIQSILKEFTNFTQDEILNQIK